MRLRSDVLRGKRKSVKQMEVEEGIELGHVLALFGSPAQSVVVMGHCEISLRSRQLEVVPHVRWVMALNDWLAMRRKIKPRFEKEENGEWCKYSLEELIMELRGTRVGIGDILDTVADTIRGEMSAISLQMPSKEGAGKITIDKLLLQEWHTLCRKTARQMRKGKLTLREQRNISDELLLLEQKLLQEEKLLEAKEKFLKMLHDYFHSLSAQFSHSVQ